MFSSIRSRVLIPYILLIALTVGGVTVFVSLRVRAEQLSSLEATLESEAAFVAAQIAPELIGATPAELADLVGEWDSLLGRRITIVAVDGRVLAESRADPATMDNHANRLEIAQALDGRQGSSQRFSRTLEEESLYVAEPIWRDGALIGAARLSLSLREIDRETARLRNTILSAGLLATILASLLGWLVAERTIRPIRRLTDVVRRTAAGDLRARIIPASRDEMGELTRAFNEMSSRLRDYVSRLEQRSARLATILATLPEAVLILDDAGLVQTVNPAATALLGVKETDVLGEGFAKVIRHHQLIALWQSAESTNEEQQAAVELDRRQLFWQVAIIPFIEANERRFLVVIQDLTVLRRLEMTRRDFVSNLSHELRTPLASLKVLIETLQDGALNDPPMAEHFLERAEIEVDALTQMVAELLELSRIESGQVPLRLAATKIDDIVRPAVSRILPQAERAGITVKMKIADALPPVLADRERLEQVVVNLLHNAVKFTPEGGRVTVSAQKVEKERLEIAVVDSGIGIPAEDLARIFERFFKSDRARSSGGTGLGLAIAKHMVQAHGGTITARSKEGKGSSFIITLPTAVVEKPPSRNQEHP